MEFTPGLGVPLTGKAINQTNNRNSKQNRWRFRQRQNSIFFFFQRVREMLFYLVLIPFFGISRMTFSRAGASKTWKWKWNGKVLVACKSAVYSNDFWPYWMLFSVRFGMSNQIKSNQIKSNHTFQYHISHITMNTIMISLNLSEWRKI